MKALLIASLLALSFTTGFTCSKNTPPEAPATTPATEMGTPPVDPATTAPTEPPPADGAAPAAPAEGETNH